VRFSNGQSDRLAEYRDIKTRRPAAGGAIRDAITVVCADPDRARRRYSIRLDSANDYMAMPFLDGDGLKTCLVWREAPDGDDAIEIVDFGNPWGDLDNPEVWPRPD
jgi:hypothetical protein